MEAVLFLVSWIMVGLVGSILGIASDIRGCDYDEDYFDGAVNHMLYKSKVSFRLRC